MKIACVKNGTKYGPEYVCRLERALRQTCSRSFEFVCLTDDQNGLGDIDCLPLTEGLPTWWAKLELFKLGEPLLYFDLDVVITDDVAELWEWDGFGILQDWAGPTFNSSVMKLTGKETHVWERFSPRFIDMVEGDQDYITGVMAGTANVFPEAWFPSYKANHCMEAVPEGAKAVIFHGFPKPHQISSGWVQAYWDGAIIKAQVPQNRRRLGGVVWPAHDDTQSRCVWGEIPNLKHVMELVLGREVVVQAGGNVGVFAKYLAKEFQIVHAFEPDNENFACMRENISEPNISIHESALGSESGACGIERTPGNSGAHHVCKGSSVAIETIDDLDLDACDLIYLDVEGFEREALKGASRTIQKFKPVIAVEENGLYRRYSEGSPSKWLVETQNYHIVAKVGRDVVLQSREGIKDAV